MGIDGWIYVAIGDFGFVDAEGTDGTKLTMYGGGVIRVRPDGTELETYADGLRNIYDVAIDPFMNLYTRGNTNDGGGWNMRVGLRDEFGLVLNDQSEGIVFHGTSEFDDLEGQIIDNPPEDCVEEGPEPPPDDEGYVNVGPNGIATQSSECCGGVPSRAIDGNTNGQWAAGSITHTSGPNSWWEVDLQDTYYISYMRTVSYTHLTLPTQA